MSTTLPEPDQARARLDANVSIAPADYAALTETSIGLVYAGLRSGTIRSVRLGQRYRIPSSWVREQFGL